MVGKKVLRGKKGERGVSDLSLYTFTPLPTLPCSTSLFYSSSCALVSAERWEINRITPLSESHEDREAQEHKRRKAEDGERNVGGEDAS